MINCLYTQILASFKSYLHSYAMIMAINNQDFDRIRQIEGRGIRKV